MIIPSPDDVRLGIPEGSGGVEFTGNMVIPSTGQVSSGIGYGSDAIEFFGTYISSGSVIINKNLNLFIRGNISGITPSGENDNFNLTLEQLFKNGDFNPQIIGRFTTNPSSVTIAVWDVMDNNSIVSLSSNDCYEIGDTNRWAFSTINLPPLTRRVNQYVFKMIANTTEIFKGEFILKTKKVGKERKRRK